RVSRDQPLTVAKCPRELSCGSRDRARRPPAGLFHFSEGLLEPAFIVRRRERREATALCQSVADFAGAPFQARLRPTVAAKDRGGGGLPMPRLTALPLIAAALALPAGGAAAQGVADFYRGKTVNFIVGFGPGGGYDLYPRVLSRHLGRHIPGNPTVVVQN